MADSGNREFVDDDRADQNGDELFDSSREGVGSGTGTRQNGEMRNGIGLAERLADIFVDENDGDLLLQQSDREDMVLQWLQALDMQLIGACRTDERIKPLLKVNVSNGVAEDRLLAHLSQHFEPSEVGMLARCFCIPLVSVRVGKINKQGTHFHPCAVRGNLILTLLPTSDLRLSFVGDDGQTEILFIVTDKYQCAAVSIDEIPVDNSGRSFLVKIPDGKFFYYWCSEKSKLLGTELLSKMKDLIKRKPSIAELTGISESRLGCFVTQLRAYLVGSTVSNTQASYSGPPSPDSVLNSIDVHSGQSSSTTSKSLRSRNTSSQVLKVNALYQGSLSPRSSSFKEGLTQNFSSLRSNAREKLRRRGENHLSVSESLAISSPISNDPSDGGNQCENDKLPNVKSCPFPPNFLESLGKFSVPPALSSVSQVSSLGSPVFSPYYCWCPSGSSTLQHLAASEFPTSSIESMKLPPLSSILPMNSSSSLLKPTPPLDLANIPSLDFPAFLPEPLVRLPMASSQQIPTFTPLICDPIVHIPVIDVCSSGGQGYLVSAGPSLSTTIPPLHPQLVNTESMVEKGARETLRLLINGSTQSNPPLIDVFPAVLTSADEKKGILVAGSRGLYSGTRDVSAIAEGIAAVSLVTLSSSSMVDSIIKRCSSSCSCDDPDANKLMGSSGSGESCSNSDGANLREEGID
ncbi:microsomal signal peptidase 25 kDa subunit family protein [Hibiscus syriacus]|uniref:Microsomal signal peptidase 25 kDa subunit family protein n=1 Tax=Hibiscus syriacus TaxID=106335 RepID=A0A6A3C6B0_HIBSY|nr:uncharacterized protein LOC120204163 [Hibiscus syriacus]KAE8724346.1 microsomal signal peptidase 25 kDa subunit family protein [Hibiscus syriacus]